MKLNFVKVISLRAADWWMSRLFRRLFQIDCFQVIVRVVQLDLCHVKFLCVLQVDHNQCHFGGGCEGCSRLIGCIFTEWYDLIFSVKNSDVAAG